MYVCIYIYIHTHTPVHIYIYTYIYIYIYIHTYTYTYTISSTKPRAINIYIYIYIHTHTCVYNIIIYIIHKIGSAKSRSRGASRAAPSRGTWPRPRSLYDKYTMIASTHDMNKTIPITIIIPVNNYNII